MTAVKNNDDFDLTVFSTVHHINSWLRSLFRDVRKLKEISKSVSVI